MSHIQVKSQTTLKQAKRDLELVTSSGLVSILIIKPMQIVYFKKFK